MVQGVPEEGPDDEGAFRAPLPPDDRLWRHPSEIARDQQVGAPGHADDLLPATPGRDPLFHVFAPSGVGELLPPPAEAQTTTAAAPPPRGRWVVGVVSGMTGAALAVGALMATGMVGRPEAPAREIVREVIRPAELEGGSGGTDVLGDVVRIADDASPAIVRIVATGDATSGGSGVIIRDDGYVVTNAHVVDEANAISAVLSDGREVAGELVGIDPQTDIAVVKLAAGESFVPAPLGTATELRIGQPAVAIGSPLGLVGGSSVTTGIISQLGRVVQAEGRPPLLDMIQTDAAIAPGSSGGALLDASGSVIGITTAIAVSDVGAEGLGFAVPIDIARAAADDIIATGRAVHVWLGIEGTSLDRRRASEMGVAGGAVVQQVVAGSPAERAGLAVDDVIVTVGDHDVISMSALVIALRRLDPGDEVPLEVRRGAERLTVSVTLSERP